MLNAKDQWFTVNSGSMRSKIEQVIFHSLIFVKNVAYKNDHLAAYWQVMPFASFAH